MPRVLGISASLQRSAALALLLALSVSTFAPVLHGAHADECEPTFLLHDERHHPIKPAPGVESLPGDDHCVACHFTRASRGAAAWEPTGFSSLRDGVLLSHSDGQLVASLSAPPLPARAPPRARPLVE